MQFFYSDSIGRERHALVKLAATFGALCLRPATRRVLPQELALACERRSDEAAAEAVGDRFEVAATLLATRRALSQRPPLGVLALNGAAGFEARIRGLIDRAEGVRHGSGRLIAAGSLVAGSALMAGNELHHGIETVLSLFFS